MQGAREETPLVSERSHHDPAKLGHAAHLIRNTILGDETIEPYESWYDPYDTSSSEFKNKLSIFCSRVETYLLPLQTLTIWVLILISFLEPPHWCRHLEDQVGEAHPFGSCGVLMAAKNEEFSYYPNFGIMFLSIGQSAAVEGVCIAILSFFLLLRFGRYGCEFQRFFYKGAIRIINLSRIILLVLILQKQWGPAYDPFFRFLFLVSFFKDIQREIITIVKMLPEVFYFMAILAIAVAFYSFMGVVIFSETPQGERDFPNWVEGTWTLWIMITTANYPDVMMPSYNSNPGTAVYFVSFMILSFFLFMNLVLATVVENYQVTSDQKKAREKKAVTDNLSKAFQIMDHEFEPDNPNKPGAVDKDTIMHLCSILNNDFPEIRYLNQEEVDVLYDVLDQDRSTFINFEEFQEFGVALLGLTKKPDYTTFVEANLKSVYNSNGFKRLTEVVRSYQFDRFIDFVLVLNAIVVVIECYPQLSGKKDTSNLVGEDEYSWDVVEFVFTIFYTLEALAKVTVDGWKKYSENPRNVFDFTITVAVLAASAYVVYPNGYSDTDLITTIVMIRVLRIGRVLLSIPTVGHITSASYRILPKAKSIVQLLFFVMYFYAAIGAHLYGGLITRDPNNPLSEILLESEFADSDYWANNFNDMMSGMNVLFNLLVINNWTICYAGFEATTGEKWVRWFFLSFHFLGVILVNNLFISFIINNFYEELRSIEKKPTETEDDEDGVAEDN